MKNQTLLKQQNVPSQELVMSSKRRPEDGVGGTVGKMKTVISVNVGLPGDLQIDGRPVPTGIFKTPVAGPVRVRTLNLDGDRQADLTVHGGADKAVYLYPSEHYMFWQESLGQDLSWGAFGENLTVAGLAEDTISIGDQLGIGTAVLQVTQPRLPCFKLAGKFQRDDIIKEFLDSRKTGFYARVLKEGVLQAGDTISLLQKEPQRVTIRELTDLYLTKEPGRSRLDRVLSVDALAASWREHFLRLTS
jgi:MOSC domain-containing protein YiiM